MPSIATCSQPPGHRLITYYAERDTPEYDALVLLDMLGSQPSPSRATQTERPSPTTQDDDPARSASTPPRS
ncbi:hypothetical protein [Streptomyces sp. PSKA30]|uniref:hypothetical protein n=1 Tax=Streptomyces sp. PSKA30 TaxID=2874597 RepID=UPI001CD0AC90|nr:hypothetical protein [Streptomyces sp. PSKA30]MBZ9645847.1 hypothetical protein [Streptomyces sp. PSKA30]